MSIVREKKWLGLSLALTANPPTKSIFEDSLSEDRASPLEEVFLSLAAPLGRGLQQGRHEEPLVQREVGGYGDDRAGPLAGRGLGQGVVDDGFESR